MPSLRLQMDLPGADIFAEGRRSAGWRRRGPRRSCTRTGSSAALSPPPERQRLVVLPDENAECKARPPRSSNRFLLRFKILFKRASCSANCFWLIHTAHNVTQNLSIWYDNVCDALSHPMNKHSLEAKIRRRLHSNRDWNYSGRLNGQHLR